MTSFVFFGTGHFAEHVLKTLIERGSAPDFIVTAPDKPVGRHQIITPPPVKILADLHGIKTIQPVTLKTVESLDILKGIIDSVEVCIVADYGKILPQALLDLSPVGFLNIHPSLLPKHRGPAPLQATILSNNPETGISIIKIDALMDHGPLIVQENVTVPNWPLTTKELSDFMAFRSAELLIEILPKYVEGVIELTEQDHDAATYTSMIEKKDGEVDIVNDSLESVYLKYCAYHEWPGVYFMHNGKRVKIKKMSFMDERYVIDRVTPEGKNEVDWSEYVKYHPL
ncbi:MAG: methionyl-tRNA formyltransferase [Patescibacteria group bacterium]